MVLQQTVTKTLFCFIYNQYCPLTWSVEFFCSCKFLKILELVNLYVEIHYLLP